MYEMIILIEGKAPSMHCKFPVPSKPGDTTKRPAPTLDEKVFKDEKGVYIPADNLRMMLIGNQNRTGAAKILGTRIESGKGAMYLDFCKACVWTSGLKDELKVYYEPIRATYDDVDIRPFITSTGGRDVTERPIITLPWSLEFKVLVADDNFAPEKIIRLYETAGMYCGVGVYGPNFGRFIIKKWNVLKKKKAK